jgi:hypothetical protein
MGAPVAPAKDAAARGEAAVSPPAPGVPGHEYGPAPSEASSAATVKHSRQNLYAGLLAVLALGVVVVVIVLLTGNQGNTTSPLRASQAPSAISLPPGTRFDGGPDEGTRGEFGHPAAQPLGI